MAGFYHLKTSKDFLVKTIWDYEQFLENSSGDKSDYYLFNLLASLTHLREWIYPKGFKAPDKSAESIFYQELHTDVDFVLIRDMSNSGKHFNGEIKMDVQDGFCAGSRVGSPLNVRNHYADNTEIRERIERLLKKYTEFLKN